MGGFFNMWLCVSLDFVKFGCVYVVGFVISGCVYVCIF